MEQAGGDLNSGSELAGNEPIHARLDAVNARTSKRIKELENVALQTTLTSVEMDLEAVVIVVVVEAKKSLKGATDI